MRCDLAAGRLGDRRDLLRREDATAPPEVGLPDGCGLMPSERSELGDRGEPLARCHRDSCLTGNASHLFGGIGNGRLFEPERIELLELTRQPDRSGSGELAVGTKQQVGSIADGLTNRSGDRHRTADVIEAGHVAVERGVRPSWVKLHGIEPATHLEGGLLSGLGRVAVNVRPLGIGVEIRVRPQRVVDPSAEQVTDRLASVLANDVPAGHLDAAHDADERRVRAQGVST